MTHDDGTPMSTNSAFYWNTGQPSIFLKDFTRGGINQATATAQVEKARAAKQSTNFNIHILTQVESDRTKAIRNSK